MKAYLHRLVFGRRVRPADDEGSILILVLGFFTLVMFIVLAAIDVTSVQLARMRLLDAADTVALDAADALDVNAVYRGGPGANVPITDATVLSAAAAHVAALPLPNGITSIRLTGASADSGRALVTLQGTTTPPISGFLLEAFGGGVTITVDSAAQAPLR